MGCRADRSWPYHLVYLFEACRVLLWMQALGARHLHVHFGTNSAEVAMLVDELGGPPYSFTVHGPEEFDKPKFIHCARKSGARLCRRDQLIWAQPAVSLGRPRLLARDKGGALRA